VDWPAHTPALHRPLRAANREIHGEAAIGDDTPAAHEEERLVRIEQAIVVRASSAAVRAVA
jgi:hypothetical protein